MTTKMTSFLSDHVHYDISKLYEGVSSNYPVLGMNIQSLRKVYESIQQESEKRYGDIRSNLQGLYYVLDRIDYILTKIESWISSGQLYENKDADIFIDSLSDRFDELEEMLKELDEGK